MTDTVTQTAADAVELIRAAKIQASAAAGALSAVETSPDSSYAIGVVAVMSGRLSRLADSVDALSFCVRQETEQDAEMSGLVPQQREPGE